MWMHAGGHQQHMWMHAGGHQQHMGMHAGDHQQHMRMHAGDHQQHMGMHAGDDLLVSAGGMPLSLATRSTCGARLKAACGNDAPCGPAVLVTWRHAIVSGDEICMQSPAEGGHKLCIRPAKDAPAVSGRVAACDGDARLGEGRRDAILVDQLGDRAARSVTQGRHQRTGIHAGEPLRLIAQAFL